MLIGIDASRAATVQRTGTEAYAYHLIAHLLPLARAAGHRVRLYYNQPPPDETTPPPPFVDEPEVEIHYLPARRVWTHLTLGRELRSNPPDLFFTPAHVIPWTYSGPSVATIHDVGYKQYPAAHPTQQRLYLDWSTRHNASQSTLVIADSEATKHDLSAAYETPPEKIRVIYPGPTPGLAPVTDAREIRRVTRKYGFRKPYFLFLSTLQPRKNLVRMIHAYDQFLNDNDGRVTRLVLAGKEGWRFEPIAAALTGLEYPNYTTIHTPGFIDDEDKAALISGAEALLFPSLYEGFGFPVLEGHACGVPVLTANSSSLPEVGGDAALYIDPEDDAALLAGMKRLLTDQSYREQLIAAGYENIKRFNWEHTASATLATLEEAVARA